MPVAAYRVSIRTPKLELTFLWGSPWAEEVTVELDPQFGSQQHYQVKHRYRYSVLSLKNPTRNTARNAAVRLRFHGFRGDIVERGANGEQDWRTVDHPQGGQALQWDGDGQASIHGTWQLVLPALDLRQVWLRTSGAEIWWRSWPSSSPSLG